ncbi:MAG: CSLREA domain-containing protein [Acidobacteriota bacterium]
MRPRSWQRERAVNMGTWCSFVRAAVCVVSPLCAARLLTTPFLATLLLSTVWLTTPSRASDSWTALGDWGARASIDQVRATVGEQSLQWGGITIPLPAPITALAAGEFDRADGLADLLVAVRGGTLLVFESPRGALVVPPLTIPLGHEVDSIQLRRVDDDPWWDAVLRGDDGNTVLFGRDRALSRNPYGDPVESAQQWRRESLDPSHVMLLDTSATPPATRGKDSTFVVNSAADTSDAAIGNGSCATATGECTLRAAIEEANATPGADTITFSLGSGTPTIAPTSALPSIIETLSILGNTGGATRVELSGVSAGAGADGLRLGTLGGLSSSSSALKSLVINRFSGVGVRIETASNTIEDCYLGSDASGAGSVSGNSGGGLLITGSAANGNTIGGSSTSVRNLISGNGAAGVTIADGAHDNSVRGNRIGTNLDGTSKLANAGAGISIAGASTNNIIGGAASTVGDPPGNLISGNSGAGVDISGAGATGTLLQGNLIGLSSAGTAALGNSSDGARAASGANATTIGGTTSSLRNVISGNGIGDLNADGVELNAVSNCVIQGNYIGLNRAGTGIIGNGGDGVRLVGSAGLTNANTVGGTTNGSGNTISGNGGSGVRVGGGGSSSNTVSGNNVGTTAGGIITIVPGNGGSGVILERGATDNVIGGITGQIPGLCIGPCNRIGYNDGDGITIVDDITVGNAIRGNTIASNDRLGIDLGADGVTPNDPTETDVGPNRRQNFPLLERVRTDETSTFIFGRIRSAPLTPYEIEFFSNTAPDPSGFGEGRTWIGTTSVFTDSNGFAPFSFTAPGTRTWISSTATDPQGNTSEFSNVIANPSEVRKLDVAPDPFTPTILRVTYTPACLATDHVIYLGIAPINTGVNWTRAFCGLGVSGTASFDPGMPPLGRAFYFVVVGQSPEVEGPYGHGRPEAVGIGACDLPMERGAVCP